MWCFAIVHESGAITSATGRFQSTDAVPQLKPSTSRSSPLLAATNGGNVRRWRRYGASPVVDDAECAAGLNRSETIGIDVPTSWGYSPVGTLSQGGLALTIEESEWHCQMVAANVIARSPPWSFERTQTGVE